MYGPGPALAALEIYANKISRLASRFNEYHDSEKNAFRNTFFKCLAKGISPPAECEKYATMRDENTKNSEN